MRKLESENDAYIKLALANSKKWIRPIFWRPDNGPPRYGEERLIQRFLWFPLTLNHDRRWLRRVTIRQIHLPVYKKFGFGNIYRSRWINGQFEE